MALIQRNPRRQSGGRSKILFHATDTVKRISRRGVRRFETLEDRRLLTFPTGATSSASLVTAWQPESAFGDNATKTAAQTGSGYNNNNGTGPVTATAPNGVWDYGIYDSGTNGGNYQETNPGHTSTQAYTFAGANEPSTFDSFGPTGSNGSLATDGIAAGIPGVAGWSNGLPEGLGGGIFYDYGNNGLNGDGGGALVENPTPSNLTTYQTGSLIMVPDGGPTATRFTAQAAGSISITSTFTDPMFDPYAPVGGGGVAQDWTWTDGQPDYAIWQTTGGNGTDGGADGGTSTLVASSFATDIFSITQADIPTYNTMTHTGGTTSAGINLVGSPTGSGGTYSMANVGPIYSTFDAEHGHSIYDPSGDQFELVWTVTQRVHVAAGDQIDFETNSEYNDIGDNPTGDLTVTPYLTAVITTYTPVSSTPPILTAGGGTAGFTAGGPAVAIDNGLTITPGSTDTSLTGATVTLNSPLSGDTLNFATQNGISVVSNTGGVLTLGGASSVANYQTALRSVTFSNSTNTTVSNRTFSIQADDTAASPVGSNSLPETVDVFAPVKVSALYVKASGWLTAFNNYLGSHSLGNSATPTLGYALQTGTAQKTDLPWTTMNTIEATFSGAVNVTASSLILSGGTGGSTPTVTGFSSLGNNTYSWTLTASTFLTNNRYEISFKASGAGAVTDTRGAGLDGDWTNGTSTFSSGDGNGLAGGNFNFLFNVTPGDADQSSLVNANDYIKVRAKLGFSTSSTAYTPYYDVDGNGLLNANDYITVRGKLGTSLPVNAPAPQTAQVGGLQTDDSLTQLALGVQEGSTSSTGASSMGAASSNFVTTQSTTGTTNTSSSVTNDDVVSSTISGSSNTPLVSTSQVQATDSALSDFDLADLWV